MNWKRGKECRNQSKPGHAHSWPISASTGQIPIAATGREERLDVILANFRYEAESGPAGPLVANQLYLRLLGDLQRIIQFNAQVLKRTLDLRVTKEKLDGPKILGASVDQGRLGAPQ